VPGDYLSLEMIIINNSRYLSLSLYSYHLGSIVVVVSRSWDY